MRPTVCQSQSQLRSALSAHGENTAVSNALSLARTVVLNAEKKTMYRLLALVLFISGIFLQVIGQEKDSIDVELKECLSVESNMTTAGMTQCTNVALDKWDAELNKYYQLLVTNLSEEGKKTLKDSQRQWIAYRDKEYAFINQYYLFEKEGTMWIPVAASKKMQLIKTRALELRTYYETFGY